MNTRGRLEKMLVDNGMFEDQAKEVLSLAIPIIEEGSRESKITWTHPSTDYPDSFYGACWVIIKKIALEWIIENKPNAWYKPMFE